VKDGWRRFAIALTAPPSGSFLSSREGILREQNLVQYGSAPLFESHRRGDQQRMRGPEGLWLLPSAGSRSITAEVSSAILDIMKHMSVRIDLMNLADWPEVCSIYEEGIATGLGTFETKAPSWEEWHAARLPHSRLVARDERVLGWAAPSPVSKRACYAGVAEVGIYVAAVARGRGIGRALLDALIDSSEANGIWTLQGATIAENTASLALQQGCGFRVNLAGSPRTRSAFLINVYNWGTSAQHRHTKLG
jgi:L-amino acid N-acyltransferase YncA